MSSCGQENRSQYQQTTNKGTPSNIPVQIVHVDHSQEQKKANSQSSGGEQSTGQTVAVVEKEKSLVQNPRIVIQTSVGLIEIELFSAASPITVANFLQYVNEGFYSKTVFHRVIPRFMIQCGGMTIDDAVDPPRYIEKPTRGKIKNEATNGLKNMRGTVAMARQPGPDTASSQFFINLINNVHLDYSARNAGYTVFGKVTAGMQVVDAIAGVETQRTVPVEPIFIISATVK
ncbi:MAG: peptidylprolyl isomerase [Planctomycetes bacterium]|nr:peptidylprolyl isomerase [Planctomycetota bacterium]